VRANDFADVGVREESFSIFLSGEQCSGLIALVAKGQAAVTLKKLADRVYATAAVMLSIGTVLGQLG
jgi:hypothetical protein